MKIGIIGSGNVGQTIAARLVSLGHQVMLGCRNVSEKLASAPKGKQSFADWLKEHDGVKLGTFSEAAAFGEMLFNVTEGVHSITALRLAGEKNLSGKVLADVSNPLDFSNGLPPSLLPSLSNTNSLGEEIQRIFPDVRVVKTLNTMWCGVMVNPAIVNEGNHTNFLCGNDAGAKESVRKILQEFGWKNEHLLDLGDITCARGTEAVLPVWLRIWGAKKSGVFNLRVVG